MIKVWWYQQGMVPTYTDFDDDVVPKVLQSGALKMVRLVEVEVPVFDAKCNCAAQHHPDQLHLAQCATRQKDGEDIVKTPEVVVAVFNGNYIMERIDE